MRKIIKFKILGNYRVELTFDDGVFGTVDLSQLVGKGVFGLWRDPHAFEKASIGTSGELSWGDKIDICPDSLYLKVTGKTPEDIFPSLRYEHTNA